VFGQTEDGPVIGPGNTGVLTTLMVFTGAL
jgi:hypothetical protein